jgi:ABC-type Fe3+-hydroxamate transport system substrate-binding protein
MATRSVLAFVLCSLFFALCACSKPAKSTPQPQSGAASCRIISTSPSNTEILVDLGFGGNIIGCDKYSAQEPGVPKSAKLIDFTYPDAETILTLKPDYIFSAEINNVDRGEDPYRLIRKIGTKVIYIPTAKSINGIYAGIMQIADALNAVKDVISGQIR